MAEKPYPSPANLTEQLQNLCWRLAVEMRALYNTVKTKMTKAEADDTYLGKTAKAASATKADTATKASQDAKGNVIDQTYAKNSAIPTVMKGATSAAAGAAGTVPAPAKGDQNKFLTGSGGWKAALTSQTQADWNATSGVAAIKNKPTIPSKTSQLTNDSNFATTGAIPTKVSQLTNDSGYLTTQVRADWNATSGYGVINNKPTVPTKLSELTNDLGLAVTVNGIAADASGNITIKGGNIEGGPFLPAAGGYIEPSAVYQKKGDLDFVGIDNKSYISFAAGMSAGYADKAGAALILAAANAPGNRIHAGSFSLAASDGNNLYVLAGLPAGGLNWGGHTVGVLVGDGDGYVRFQSGLQICWGRTSWGNLTSGWSGKDKTVSFALPFVDANYGLTTGTDFGGSGFSYFMCTCTERTTTGFKHQCWWNESSSVHRTVEAVATWTAIGRWK